MTYLVAAETALLALVSLLVAGLLRSHAEILRRLGDQPAAAMPLDDGSFELLPRPRTASTPPLRTTSTDRARTEKSWSSLCDPVGRPRSWRSSARAA